jgi:hypothetical protein
MSKFKFYVGLCFAIVACIVIIGSEACRKSKNTAEDIGYASDHATSEQTFNDVQTIADQASTVTAGTLGFKTTIGGCATVTHSGNVTTIDFGPVNCVCHDGRSRRGKIIATCIGNFLDSGSVRTITFDNFFQNNNKITGTKTVTNAGRNADGRVVFNIHIAGAVTLQGGGTISSQWDRTRTWTKGYDTPADMTDDEFEITGSGTMTRANGTLVSIKITSPLICATSCHWIQAGSVTYSLSSGASRVLNFGDVSNCDDQATLTLANGMVKAITLH